MNNPLFDVSLSFEERTEWLLSQLTADEKCGWISSRLPACERLGVLPFGLGAEAAHGVQGRNDQGLISQPDITTSFPQPIGMSRSWDEEMMQQCGQVVGVEARVVAKRKNSRGLSRWAPTVDLERDPRWGRHEEAYGEDPLLIGKLAGAYIRGMQGEDEKYIRCASTLKHFYANNTEAGRAWKNASIDPRNKYELYLEPFRRCIEEAGVQGVMTAYNRINGQVGILNHDVADILKSQYGLPHVVGDGGALNLVVTCQHHFGNHAEAVAAALKAGVDGMSDNPVMVEQAAREALALGLISEDDLDEAIRRKVMVAMRLGHFDGEQHPYAHYSEEDICTREADALALKMAEESLVLLKNEGLLPLQKNASAALLGPMAHTWYTDWYGGVPPCKMTVKDGMESLRVPHTCFDGWDRVKLRFGNKGAYVNEDGTVSLSENPDVFIMEDWGENSYTFRCQRTGKYLCMHMPEGSGIHRNPLRADRTEPFDWFALEIFRFEDTEKGRILLNRFSWPVEAEENMLVSGSQYTGTPMTVELVESGIEKAVQLAKENENAVLTLGNTPLIPAKEEYDRHTLSLPAHQQKLMEAVWQANPRTALVLVANYPYAVSFAREHLPAIVVSASGGQQMGTAIAHALYGVHAPAGRLSMTWPQSENQLPDMDDYDIIRGRRTYRYFDQEALFPFGHGLTYTTFRYGDFSVFQKDDRLLFTFTVENTGTRASDEVAQVYAVAPASRVQKPLRQLVAFQRLKDIQPGEKRLVQLYAKVAELRFYDVISQSLMVEEGDYRFFAGPSSREEACTASLFIPGEHTGKRSLLQRIPADHYDDCENIAILQGSVGYTAICVRPGEDKACAVYRDCLMDDESGYLSLRIKSVQGGRLTVLWNGQEMGRFEGDTRTLEHRSAPPMNRFAAEETAARNRERHPIWEDIELPLPEDAGEGTLTLQLEGDLLCSFFTTKKAPGERKIRLGIAN